MTQYIKKSALVAEIERRIDRNNEKAASYSSNSEHDYLYRFEENVYKSLLSFINTLGVKDVDFEKEFDDYTKDILAYDIQFEPFTHLHNCAKHFFELGLKAKGE
jgi:molecular chaperone GrpE (heat shock protein)